LFDKDDGQAKSSVSVSTIMLRDKFNAHIYNLFVLKLTCLKVLPAPAPRAVKPGRPMSSQEAPCVAAGAIALPAAAGTQKTTEKTLTSGDEEDGADGAALSPAGIKPSRAVETESADDPGEEEKLRRQEAAAALTKAHPVALSEEKKKLLRTVLKDHADLFSPPEGSKDGKPKFLGWPENWYSLLNKEQPGRTKQEIKRAKRVHNIQRLEQMMTQDPEEMSCPRKYKRVAFLMTSGQLADFPLVAATDSFERMHGYTRSEFHGRNPRFLQGPKTSPSAVLKLRTGLATKRTASTVMVNYRKDGSMFTNEVKLIPMKDKEGSIVSYLGFIAELDKDYQTLQNAETLLSLSGVN